jgi:hypothetical protein
VVGAIDAPSRTTLQIRFANGAVLHVHRAKHHRIWFALRPYIPFDLDWAPHDVAHRQDYQRAALDTFFCGVPYVTHADLDQDLYAVEK